MIPYHRWSSLQQSTIDNCQFMSRSTAPIIKFKTVTRHVRRIAYIAEFNDLANRAGCTSKVNRASFKGKCGRNVFVFVLVLMLRILHLEIKEGLWDIYALST